MLTHWLFVLLLLAGCWSSRDDWGDLTIINTGTAEFHATLYYRGSRRPPARQSRSGAPPHGSKARWAASHQEPIVLAPGAHRNWRSTPTGRHQLVAADGAATELRVARGRATIVDTTGTGCYVVGDYGNQYRPNSAGEVVILERFKQQPVFTTHHSLLILYGEPLPASISEGVRVRAMARVDCRIVDRDREVVESIRRTP